MSPIPGSNEPAKIFPYKIKEPAKTFFSQKKGMFLNIEKKGMFLNIDYGKNPP